MRGQIDRAGALVIAQAELEVLRVRAVVRTVSAKLTGYASHRPAAKSRESEKQAARPLPLGEKRSCSVGDLAGGIEELKMLNRYLRRALAKRDQAVRLALEHVSAPSA